MNIKEIELIKNKYTDLIKEEIQLNKSSITSFELDCSVSICKKYKEGTYINGRIEVDKKKINFILGSQVAEAYFKNHETVVFILKNGSFCFCAKKSEFEQRNQSLIRLHQIKQEKARISKTLDEILNPEKNIKFIEIKEEGVTFKYSNNKYEKVSFSKANLMIKESHQYPIEINFDKSQQSVNFLTKLPKKYFSRLVIQNN